MPWAGHEKKTFAACEQDPVERAVWRWHQAWLALPAERLVFVDESGSNKALAPRYGYAPKGERFHGTIPRNRGRNTSILAAMSAEGLVGTMTVEGATNTEVFLTYLDAVLCPALRPGQIVVMDNLAVHKNEAVRERIQACGCRLLFLPAYSPDFNPIERWWRELKDALASRVCGTLDALRERLDAELATWNHGPMRLCSLPSYPLPH